MPQATSLRTRARSNSRRRCASGMRIVRPDEFQRLLVGEKVAALRQIVGRVGGGRRLVLEPLEEEADRDVERLGDVPEPRRADPVHAGFVLLDLLKLDPDDVAELLLGHADHPAAMPDPLCPHERQPDASFSLLRTLPLLVLEGYQARSMPTVAKAASNPGTTQRGVIRPELPGFHPTIIGRPLCRLRMRDTTIP